MKSKYLSLYFEAIFNQRENFYERIANYQALIWVRPHEEKWSLGETFYHLYLMVKRFRQLNKFYLLLAEPVASLRKNTPYATKIHDIYEEYQQKQKKTMIAPFVILPPKGVENKISFNQLVEELETETKVLEQMVSAIEDNVAGHIRYPDPIAHHPNLIQAVQLIGLHEQHHFRLCAKYYNLAE